jgi:molybdopterin molybdotransferase
MTDHSLPLAPHDVRRLGFARRIPLAAALDWVVTHTRVLETEVIPVADAAHRVLAAPVHAGLDRPGADVASHDGYAARAADVEAADPYAPLPLQPSEGSVWHPGTACLIAAGGTMPAGTDAVLPFDAVEPLAGSLAATAPAAPGSGVRRQGSEALAGRQILPQGRQLRSTDPAFLAALDATTVAVVRRPVVALLVIGPKSGDADLLGPTLETLITRDGGDVRHIPVPDDLPAVLARAAAASDLLIVAGRTGCGADDDTAQALRSAGGMLAIHGVATQPAGSTGLGQCGTTPVLLLPGDPPAGMAAYLLLAAPVVRRLGGLSAPAPAAMVPLHRKIASAIGVVELVFVRLQDGSAVPLAADSLAPLHADGYVVVPEPGEGFAAGTLVPFHPF